jgi:murein DD-endopeptidase MepM/ murein hydrolase activator NlpD
VKTILVALVLISAAAAAQTPVAPSFEGDWHGTLSAGPTTLRLVFQIRKGPDGSYSGQLNSLDQGVRLPLDAVQLSGDAVRLEASSVKGAFAGTLSGDSLKGIWSQGVPLPLELKRQTPVETSAMTAAAAADMRKKIFESSGVPMDIRIPIQPAAFTGHGGASNLIYEIHLTNLSPVELHVERIEVLNGEGLMASFDGAALGAMLRPFGPPGGGDNRTVAAGMRTVAFLLVRFNAPTPAPAALRHRITIDGRAVETTVAVSAAKPPVLGPPLRGGDWQAGNGPSNTSGHRRALMPIDGRLAAAQRFAIDWVKIGANGLSFDGDAKDNKAYYAYGAELLAVADAVVADTKDGIPENVPGIASRAVPITLDTVGGNYVVLDLGGGNFAFYAHLQPGSLKVKTGDKVRRGQVLGLLGNSGNSTEPHLHFHVSDGMSPLGSEGVPYHLDAFEVTSPVAAGPKKNALPLEGARVRF